MWGRKESRMLEPTDRVGILMISDIPASRTLSKIFLLSHSFHLCKMVNSVSQDNCKTPGQPGLLIRAHGWKPACGPSVPYWGQQEPFPAQRLCLRTHKATGSPCQARSARVMKTTVLDMVITGSQSVSPRSGI